MILGYASMFNENTKDNRVGKFDKNKKYVYDLETVLQDTWKKKLYESGYSKNFTDEADGKEVEVIDEYNARVVIFEKHYLIDRSSCKEI